MAAFWICPIVGRISFDGCPYLRCGVLGWWPNAHRYAFAPGSGSPSAIALAPQPRLEEGGEGAIDELNEAADASDALDARAFAGRPRAARLPAWPRSHAGKWLVNAQ